MVHWQLCALTFGKMTIDRGTEQSFTSLMAEFCQDTQRFCAKPLFMSWQRSAFNDVLNDCALDVQCIPKEPCISSFYVAANRQIVV